MLNSSCCNVLENLKKEFKDAPPRAVIIGKQGSGKTTLAEYLMSFRTWNGFLGKDSRMTEPCTMLQITWQLGVAGTPERMLAYDRLANRRDYEAIFRQGHFDALFRQRLEAGDQNWADFWCPAGLLAELDSLAVFVFDGIDDLLTEHGDKAREAISALLRLPNRFAELPFPRAGCLLFVRPETLNLVISQNVGQYMQRFSQFSLKEGKEGG